MCENPGGVWPSPAPLADAHALFKLEFSSEVVISINVWSDQSYNIYSAPCGNFPGTCL